MKNEQWFVEPAEGIIKEYLILAVRQLADLNVVEVRDGTSSCSQSFWLYFFRQKSDKRNLNTKIYKF